MATSLCDKCVALCCRYVALPIDNPDCAKDFDNIRWYLVHQNMVVFIEKKQWYLGIFNRCKHLQKDNRCGIYHTRPQLCRGYTTDNCDYHGGDYGYSQLFTSADQLVEYAEKTLNKKLKKGQKPIRLIPEVKAPAVKRRRAADGRVHVELPVVG